MTQTTNKMKMETLTISFPKEDLKRLKGIAKAMGWTLDTPKTMDETEYVNSNPKIMDAIREGEEAIAKGNITTTNLDDLWK